MTPATPEHLFARLDALGITHSTTPHRPVFTVGEGLDLKAQIPGGHSKNLFLKDKKGALFLLCALGDSAIDLNAVAKSIGAGRLSFGSAELLLEYLGVAPGAVTLFALINDPDRRVTLLLDEGFLAHGLVNFHPLRNDATTTISADAMKTFIASLGRTPIRIAFDAAGASTLIEPDATSAHIGA